MKKRQLLFVLAMIIVQTTHYERKFASAQTSTQNWRPLPGGALGAHVSAITTFGSYLWVGGAFTYAGPISAQYIVRHDGFKWIPTPSLPNPPFGFCEYNGELFALGGFEVGTQRYGVMKWTGTSWFPMALVDQGWGRMQSGAVYNGELVLGGQFYSVDGIPAQSMIRWNGTSWSTFSGQTTCFWIWPPRVYGLHVAYGHLYAAGSFDQIGGVPSSCASKWNGTNWSPSLSIGWNTYARGFVHSGNDLYVYGIFPYAGSATSPSVAKEGPGNYWINAGNGARIAGFTGANYRGKVYIAGGGATNGGDYIGNCGYWNGSMWVPDNQGIGGGAILALHTDTINDILYAGGQFRTLGGDIADYVAYKSEISLPVKMLSFDCSVEEENFARSVNLSWQTATEINADYFSISVSSDAVNYKQIGIVSAHGNSSLVRSYNFRVESSEIEKLETENPELNEKNNLVYFCLEQYDFDGTRAGIWNCATKIKLPNQSKIKYVENLGLVICDDCENEIIICSGTGAIIEKSFSPIVVVNYPAGIYFAQTTGQKTNQTTDTWTIPLRFLVDK